MGPARGKRRPCDSDPTTRPRAPKLRFRRDHLRRTSRRRRDDATDGGSVLGRTPRGGESSPSPEDVALRREIVNAGRLLDIEILDHLVIGRGERGFVSLKERGLGFDRQDCGR